MSRGNSGRWTCLFHWKQHRNTSPTDWIHCLIGEYEHTVCLFSISKTILSIWQVKHWTVTPDEPRTSKSNSNEQELIQQNRNNVNQTLSLKTTFNDTETSNSWPENTNSLHWQTAITPCGWRKIEMQIKLEQCLPCYTPPRCRKSFRRRPQQPFTMESMHCKPDDTVTFCPSIAFIPKLLVSNSVTVPVCSQKSEYFPLENSFHWKRCQS